MEKKRVYYYEDDRIKTAASLSRYEFALRFVENRSVLDIGCGARRGPRLLSDKASAVTGIDISQEAVDYCQRAFPSPRVRYRVADATALPFADETFDVVTAFEVIEHLEQQELFVREARRVLKNGGTLIMSTPNRIVMSPEGIFSNPDHIKEFSAQEFSALLSGAFSAIHLYGQKPSRRVQDVVESRRQSYQEVSKVPVFLRHLVPASLRQYFFGVYVYLFSKRHHRVTQDAIREKDFLISDIDLEQAHYLIAVSEG